MKRIVRAGRLALLPLACGVALFAPAQARGQDQVEIVASKAGFRPAAVTLRRGETARLILKTADDEHCFAVDALRIEKRISPGRPSSVELTPEQVAELAFYCCLEPDNPKLRGKLIVVE